MKASQKYERLQVYEHFKGNILPEIIYVEGLHSMIPSKQLTRLSFSLERRQYLSYSIYHTVERETETAVLQTFEREETKENLC